MASVFGRVERLPSGRYRARYPDPTPGSKARIPAPTTFDTKTAARQWLAARQTEIASGSWVHPDEAAAAAAEAAVEAEAAAAAEAVRAVPLGEYAARWIDTRTNSKGAPLSPTTLYNYRNLWKPAEPKSKGRRAKPAGRLHEWADVPVNTITADTVRAWYLRQLKDGRQTAVARAYDHLRSVLKSAVEDGLIDRNPAAIKGASRIATGIERNPPTDDELATVIEAMPDNLAPFVILAGFAGLRFGEAAALRKRDVEVMRADDEVDAVRVTVGDGVVYTPEVGRKHRGSTKTGITRTVTVYGVDAATIAAHVEQLTGPEALLFTDASGQHPLSHSSFWHHWERARDAAGRPDLALHALRGYDATRFSQLGATLAEVMARLGHTTVEAALRYQKTGSRDEELGRRMGR